MGIKVTIAPLGAVDNSSFLTDLNIGIGRLATEFDSVVYRDGTQALTGHLDVGGKRLYNLGAPVAPTDAMRLVDATAFQGTPAVNPVFTVATGGPGSSVLISGVYPNLLLTIPAGVNGISGALSDGNYSDIAVAGSGASLTVRTKTITTSKMADMNAVSIMGNSTAGFTSPQNLSVATVRTMLSISNVDNTTDALKPVSTAQAAAIAAKADLASPVLTGNPTAPTAAPGDADLSIATTAFVAAAVTADNTAVAVRTIPVLASAMYPRYTNGPGTSVVETATNKVNFNTVDFDGATNEFAQFLIPMPKGWDEGTVSVQFLWRSTGGTGGVVWGIQGVALSDGDTADSAYGTAATVTDSVISTAALMASPYTAAMTIAGTPAPEDLISFQVYRDAANGSDTSVVDAQLVGIRIKYNVNARDDS